MDMRAVDRLAATLDPMTYQQRAGYMFLALGLLGAQEPDVLTFILDRTDERVAD